MSSTSKRCINCGWIGNKAKFTSCSSCGTTYYQCFVCGGKMETIPKLSGIQVDLWIKNRDGSDEELDRYFIHKFKELGLDVDAPRKRKVKSRVDMRVQKEKKSKTDDENIIVRKPTTHAS